MRDVDQLAQAHRRRNEALDAAHAERARATRDAQVEYAEAVAKLRERFEAELAHALALHREAVRPAHRRFNAAVIRAERAFIDAERRLAPA